MSELDERLYQSNLHLSKSDPIRALQIMMEFYQEQQQQFLDEASEEFKKKVFYAKQELTRSSQFELQSAIKDATSEASEKLYDGSQKITDGIIRGVKLEIGIFSKNLVFTNWLLSAALFVSGINTVLIVYNILNPLS